MREKIRGIFVVFGGILVVMSFIVPVYYLKWHEILVLHCSCVLITFILSKTVNSRKFSEPENIYQFTFFLGLAGLITNLISWKKSSRYDSKDSIHKPIKSENSVHKTIKSNSIDHISIMYYLREKIKTSTEIAVFESTKQELINLIKKHSPKDSSGNYVSISFVKEDTDYLDGIVLSEIEKMQFDKFNHKDSNSEEVLINQLTEFLTKEIHKARENDSTSSQESEETDKVNSERNKIDQTLTEDQERWLELLDRRVKSMPLETLKKLGDTVDIIANDHLLEYKANEPNIPKDIRKKVAKERVQGLLSIKDYVLKNGDEEQIFHIESSLKAAELYASTLGINNITLNQINNNFIVNKMSAPLNENNNKNGEEKFFHDDGSVKNICYWENGVQQGPAYTYDKQGNLLKKSNLVNGGYHGEQIEFYPSGNTKIRRIWVDNFKSEEYEYTLDGELICEYSNNGKKVKQTNYYKNGNIRFQVEKPIFTDDRDQDDFHVYNSYWFNGKLMCKSKFKFQWYGDRNKKQIIEEKYLENGELIKDILLKENLYTTGEIKESELEEDKVGVGKIRVSTGFYKNGNIKYINYHKLLPRRLRTVRPGASKFRIQEYGNWIYYNKRGEVLFEKEFTEDENTANNFRDNISEVYTRNQDVFEKTINDVRFNISLGSISKNKDYTYYLIKISAEEDYDGIDLYNIRNDNNVIVGETQLYKDISKLQRSIAITSSRNGEFFFSIKDIGRIVEDVVDRGYNLTAETNFVREQDEYYKNFCFENTVVKNITLNEKPLLLSEIGDFLDSIPEITVDTIKKIQEPDIQSNFLHCFDDISQLKPFLNQNAAKPDINKVLKIKAEGIEYDEIEVGRGVYDYLCYHSNGEKYIEFKSSIFKQLEWHYNSDISEEFEMDDSSELNVYNKNGESINKFTVFLCPNKSYETVIIFEVNKNDLLKIENWLFTSLERIKSLLTNKSHFVNCVSNEIDLEQAPPVLLNSSSQDVLGYLANYVPEKEFVLLRRWEDGNDFCDEVYVTCSKSKKYRNDKELKKFPGSKNMDKYINEYNYNEPDYFYVYEKEVFDSLELKKDRIKLKVKKYNTKPKI